MRTGRLVLTTVLAVAVGLLPAVPAAAHDGTASITGTVTAAADGRPLSGVCVDVYGEVSAHSAVTRSDGTYRVAGLGAGEHLVAFNSCEEPVPGFAGELYDDARSFEDATPVVLRAGQARAAVDAALDPAAVLSGRVTDDDTAAGIAGVCVLAFEEEGGGFGRSVTGEDGDWAIANLRGGTYQVLFQDCSDPMTYLPEAYDDVPLEQSGQGAPRPTPVTVADGETVGGLDAGLEEGGSIEGTLVGLHHGQPLSGVCLAAYDSEGDRAQPVAVTISGFSADLSGEPQPGRYVFGSLRPGTYDVVPNPADVCGEDGYSAGPARRDLVVERGEVTEGGELVLAPQPSISAACGFSSSPGEPQQEPPFSDVRNVHTAAIECLAAYEVVKGRTDGTYGPAELVRRDQMASFVARSLTVMGVVLPDEPADAFSDDDGSVHERAINQLAALGVVTGRADREFAPALPVTRGQTATLVVRAYEEATGFTLIAARDAFVDDEGDVHEQRIDQAATAGLAAGDGTHYTPLADVRRDQMATLVARLLDRVRRDVPDRPFTGGPYPGPAPAPAKPPPAESAASSPLLGLLARR